MASHTASGKSSGWSIAIVDSRRKQCWRLGYARQNEQIHSAIFEALETRGPGVGMSRSNRLMLATIATHSLIVMAACSSEKIDGNPNVTQKVDTVTRLGV